MFRRIRGGLSPSRELTSRDPLTPAACCSQGIFFNPPSGEAKASKKEGDTSPTFNEDFTFQLPELKDMQLNVRVRTQASRPDPFFTLAPMGLSHSQLPKSLLSPPLLLHVPQQLMNDAHDAGPDAKLGGVLVPLDKISLEKGPLNNYEVKIDRHLFHNEVNVFLNLSWEA
jgi:hypothetical protein